MSKKNYLRMSSGSDGISTADNLKITLNGKEVNGIYRIDINPILPDSVISAVVHCYVDLDIEAEVTQQKEPIVSDAEEDVNAKDKE